MVESASTPSGTRAARRAGRTFSGSAVTTTAAVRVRSVEGVRASAPAAGAGTLSCIARSTLGVGRGDQLVLRWRGDWGTLRWRRGRGTIHSQGCRRRASLSAAGDAALQLGKTPKDVTLVSANGRGEAAGRGGACAPARASGGPLREAEQKHHHHFSSHRSHPDDPRRSRRNNATSTTPQPPGLIALRRSITRRPGRSGLMADTISPDG